MRIRGQNFVVDESGKITAVIIPLDRFNQLMEDLHDLAVVAERRDEKVISLQVIKRRLKKDRLI